MQSQAESGADRRNVSLWKCMNHVAALPQRCREWRLAAPGERL
jgi:hypothetical protein